MKPARIATILIVGGLLTGAAWPAAAGTEPSPTRFALGAERLEAAASFAAVLARMADELTEVSFDELTRPEARALTGAAGRMARQLRHLERLTALVGKDLLDTTLNSDPPAEDREAVRLALAALADHAATVAARAEAYLGSPPDDQSPLFLAMLRAVLAQANGLRERAVDLSVALEGETTEPPR